MVACSDKKVFLRKSIALMQQLHFQIKFRNITKGMENNKSLEWYCFTVSGLMTFSCGSVVKGLLSSNGFIDSSEKCSIDIVWLSYAICLVLELKKVVGE